MANSASDAARSEREIRRQLIESKTVDVMVAISTNFFYTVTLPVTLWFLDKGKGGTDREDMVLFIDARRIYRQIDRAHRDFRPEQIELLANVVRLYRREGIETVDGSEMLLKPDPVLDDAQREVVKASAKRLLVHLHDKLVLDWRRKVAATADVHTTILDVLDADLPADPYPPEVFDAKVQAVFDHIVSAYGDDGSSVYGGTEDDAATAGQAGVAVLTPPDLDTLTEGVIERIRVDAEFASRVAEQLGVVGGAALRTVEELIENDEDFAVEFKSTARWDLREGQPSKAMEDAVVKTVAGFLNTDGGTLIIGVGPDRETVGLSHDYARVKPPNGDGFVNWLTTHLTNAVGHAAVMRTRARIAVHTGHEVCRVDVGRSSEPVWAKTSKQDRVFFVRMNNSTRALPEEELAGYLNDRWPGTAPPSGS